MTLLHDALPAGIDIDACTVATLGALRADHSVDYDGSYWRDDISDDAQVVILPGWFANDGNAEVDFSNAEDGKEAAQEYVKEGEWGEIDGTSWITVSAWRKGFVLADEEAEELIDLRIDDESHTITLEPATPACEDGHEHDWRSPHSVVGGLRENPGVQGHGGGVIVTEVCAHCGKYRITDTWAQNRATGEQGLTSVSYKDADEKSTSWAQGGPK